MTVGQELVAPQRGGQKIISRVRTADGRSAYRKEWPGPHSSERLRREALILRRLAGVEGVPELLVPCDGTCLLLGVYDAGYLTGSAPLPPDELVGLAHGLARILAGVHSRGVVHKNIKPANVMRTSTGRPYLIDFDLASTFAEERPGFTHQSQIAGTLAYVAPEQTGRTGRPVDQRADLYALGATLYFFAVGHAPFGEGDPLQLVRDHLGRRPAPPHDLNPKVPAQLSDVILRLLEKEPDRRYQSAEGLAHDLERLRRTGNARIRLGERDFPPRLAPPSHLIGRDAELAGLRAAFDDALTGAARGVLVAGAPGVGKTALVNELRPAATAAGGWFVAGKFDQYRRDRDSDAVRQALRALGRLLLAEPDTAIEGLRERLREAAGANVTVVATELPEFALLMAAEPGVAEVDDGEYGARFRQGCLDVLRVVARPADPVIMVVDDLQWGGADPIRVVDAIMSDPALSGVLLVGSYRDGEADETHPLTAARARWAAAGRAPEPIVLHNLRDADLVDFLGEMMRLEPPAARTLAAAIGPRTGGNPYDTIELINALRRDDVLRLGPDGWTWDAGAIRGWIGSGDVLDLVSDRIDGLPEASREVLALIAGLGGEVDLTVLRAAGELTAGELSAGLRPVLEEGLLVLEHETVRFRHDRVQQAAYARVPAAGRPRLHRRLARALATEDRYAGLAAEQYLRAADLLDEPAEGARAVSLFRAAAATLRLVDSPAAERFLTTALDLAGRGLAGDDPALPIRLRTDLHATLYLLNRPAEADELYADLAGRCTDPVDLVEAACVQMASLTNRRQMAEALRLGEEMLAHFGVTRPADLTGTLPARLRDIAGWAADLDDHPDLRPEVTDRVLTGVAKLLDKALAPAFFVDRTAVAWLVVECHRRWVAYGPTVALTAGLARVAAVMIEAAGDYRSAYTVARHLLATAERRGYVFAAMRARFVFAGFAQAWFEPLEENVATARRVREEMLQGGDVQYAVFAYQLELPALVECARSLEALDDTVVAALALGERTGNELAATTFRPFQQFHRALRGLTARPDGSFDDDRFTEDDFLLRSAPQPIGRLNFHVLRALSALLFGDRAALARHSAAAMPLLPAAPGMVITSTAYVVRALGVLHEITERDTPEGRAEYARIHGWLRDRAVDSPGTFAQLVALVEAESRWADGDRLGALRRFEAALRLVRGADRRWHEALIYERAGRAQVAVGLDFTGTVLLGRARAAYLAWGAGAKAATLPMADDDAGLAPAEATRPISESIDLLAVLEASRLLSSETNVRRLRERVAGIVGAMTGATGVWLLRRDDDGEGWLIGTPSGDLPLSSPAAAGLLPVSAVRFAERTGRTLLVPDAVTDGRFDRDPRIARLDVCSLLITPVTAHGQVRGLLVVENTLTRDAFPPGRLDAVGMIAGQLAVCLDHALLYESMERKVAERTRELETANRRRVLLSTTDALTGCANRRHFTDRLEALWNQAARDGRPLSVVMIDVDHFKLYNDHYGHVGGDECLRAVADTIRGAVRLNDLAARYGGEEFALILPATAAEALVVAERVRSAVERLRLPHEESVGGHVTVSAGLAEAAPAAGGLPADLVEAADAELYRAKRGGRNQVASAFSAAR